MSFLVWSNFWDSSLHYKPQMILIYRVRLKRLCGNCQFLIPTCQKLPDSICYAFHSQTRLIIGVSPPKLSCSWPIFIFSALVMLNLLTRPCRWLIISHPTAPFRQANCGKPITNKCHFPWEIFVRALFLCSISLNLPSFHLYTAFNHLHYLFFIPLVRKCVYHSVIFTRAATLRNRIPSGGFLTTINLFSVILDSTLTHRTHPQNLRLLTQQLHP